MFTVIIVQNFERLSSLLQGLKITISAADTDDKSPVTNFCRKLKTVSIFFFFFFSGLEII